MPVLLIYNKLVKYCILYQIHVSASESVIRAWSMSPRLYERPRRPTHKTTSFLTCHQPSRTQPVKVLLSACKTPNESTPYRNRDTGDPCMISSRCSQSCAKPRTALWSLIATFAGSEDSGAGRQSVRLLRQLLSLCETSRKESGRKSL